MALGILLLLAALIGAAVAPLASAHHRPGHGGTGGSGVPGTWQSTGDMLTARRTVSGALLADGRVLVAGGFVSATTDTVRSELYDPTTGRWTASRSLQEPRRGHTLTRLTDGRVLAAGGTTGDYIQAVLRSAELYDPTKGTWQATGWMTHGRSGHGAVLLADGRVLVESIGTAELYDPKTGTWSATGPMVSRRGTADTVTLLQDGRVLVAAGGPLFGSKPSPVSATAELYDPATNTWSATGSLSTARWGHQASLLADGRVLVVGGLDANGTTLACAEIYDPGTGSWTQVASMNVPRNGHKATRLADGRVLVAAGDADAPSAEIFDPTAGTWTPTANMVVRRAPSGEPFMSLLADGRVLVAGGAPAGSSGEALASAELFTP